MTGIRIDQVTADANLLQAWYKVRANQGCAGIDGVTIPDFERRLLPGLELLRDEVRYETYRPRPLLRISVPKKGGTGTRPLSIPVVRDRILQTAAALLLTPVFEAEFEECSYAYRPGRSVDMAVRRVEQLRDEGFTWVVDADISSFFDEIDHSLLLERVNELCPEPALGRLIRMWVRADIREGNKRYTLRKGVPQGSPISPLLVNLYLDRLDEAAMDNNLRLVRFSDDFLILCRHKKDAGRALKFTEKVLESLRLHLNPGKTRVVDFTRGFRFLGVEFVRSLALKTKCAPPPSLVEEIERTGECPREIVADLGPPQTENVMAMAFSRAGVRPEDFPDQVEQVMEVAPDDGEIFTEGRVADHDPRLRTLYLLEHGYVLGKESERFTIRRQNKVVRRIPAIKVDQIMVFGNAQITTQAMHFCLTARIPVYLLTGQGRYFGVIDSFDTEPVLLQRDQFVRAADPAFCLDISREFVRGKIANCRLIQMRYGRKRNLEPLRTAADELRRILATLDGCIDLNQLRGKEGTAARTYFRSIAPVLDPDWRFTRRTRQPPTDPVNALLSYGYTLLFYNLYSFLRARGLNPQVGFLHPIRSGHPALVSDIIEEFRAIIVDAVVLNLVLNRRVKPGWFSREKGRGGGCRMNDRARNLFIHELEKKLNTSLIHPVSGLRLDYRRCIEHQVNQLASVIRGGKERYQALVLR